MTRRITQTTTAQPGWWRTQTYVDDGDQMRAYTPIAVWATIEDDADGSQVIIGFGPDVLGVEQDWETLSLLRDAVVYDPSEDRLRAHLSGEDQWLGKLPS